MSINHTNPPTHTNHTTPTPGIRRTYTPSGLLQLRTGAWSNKLGWSAAVGCPPVPEFTPDGLLIVVRAASPSEILPAGKWADVPFNGHMFVRDGLAVVSVTTELVEAAEISQMPFLVPPGSPVPSYIRIRPRAKMTMGLVLLHVGSLK